MKGRVEEKRKEERRAESIEQRAERRENGYPEDVVEEQAREQHHAIEIAADSE
jgi:hypothetical protein